jgi:hypothetical protein
MSYQLVDEVHPADSSCGPASGSPVVAVVQSTHDWTSDHLGPYILR